LLTLEVEVDAGRRGRDTWANNNLAVAGVDLTKKIKVDVRGEILELKETVNG